MKKKHRIRRGTVMMVLGAMMIFGALSLLLYNRHKEAVVGERSNEILTELEELISVITPPSEEIEQSRDDLSSLLESDGHVAEEQPSREVNVGDAPDEETGETLPEGYIASDMPCVVLDDHYYIGVLDMPALGITLPVQWGWSDQLMDISPCRYNGTLQDNDFIIMAHNYSTHFGTIFNLTIGDSVFFTDVLGNHVEYVVCAVDVFGRSEIWKMYDGDWDMTLFTCVPNTYNRIAVRCRRV